MQRRKKINSSPLFSINVNIDNRRITTHVHTNEVPRPTETEQVTKGNIISLKTLKEWVNNLKEGFYYLVNCILGMISFGQLLQPARESHSDGKTDIEAEGTCETAREIEANVHTARLAQFPNSDSSVTDVRLTLHQLLRLFGSEFFHEIIRKYKKELKADRTSDSGTSIQEKIEPIGHTASDEPSGLQESTSYHDHPESNVNTAVEPSESEYGIHTGRSDDEHELNVQSAPSPSQSVERVESDHSDVSHDGTAPKGSLRTSQTRKNQSPVKLHVPGREDEGSSDNLDGSKPSKKQKKLKRRIKDKKASKAQDKTDETPQCSPNSQEINSSPILLFNIVIPSLSSPPESNKNTWVIDARSSIIGGFSAANYGSIGASGSGSGNGFTVIEHANTQGCRCAECQRSGESFCRAHANGLDTFTKNNEAERFCPSANCHNHPDINAAGKPTPVADSLSTPPPNANSAGAGNFTQNVSTTIYDVSVNNGSSTAGNGFTNVHHTNGSNCRRDSCERGGESFCRAHANGLDTFTKNNEAEPIERTACDKPLGLRSSASYHDQPKSNINTAGKPTPVADSLSTPPHNAKSSDVRNFNQTGSATINGGSVNNESSTAGNNLTNIRPVNNGSSTAGNNLTNIRPVNNGSSTAGNGFTNVHHTNVSNYPRDSCQRGGESFCRAHANGLDTLTKEVEIAHEIAVPNSNHIASIEDEVTTAVKKASETRLDEYSNASFTLST